MWTFLGKHREFSWNVRETHREGRECYAFLLLGYGKATLILTVSLPLFHQIGCNKSWGHEISALVRILEAIPSHLILYPGVPRRLSPDSNEGIQYRQCMWCPQGSPRLSVSHLLCILCHNRPNLRQETSASKKIRSVSLGHNI